MANLMQLLKDLQQANEHVWELMRTKNVPMGIRTQLPFPWIHDTEAP